MKNSTNTILMVRPSCFGINTETAQDNLFQHETTVPSSKVSTQAQEEFDHYSDKLKKAGVNVIIVNDTKSPIKPDAIFPNNWFSTHATGQVYLYPMKALNRRAERQNPILETLEKHFHINSVIDLTDSEKDNLFLEGTGSIVFNHIHKIAYACLSQRTDKDLFLQYCKNLNYLPITFQAYDSQGVEIYHTNVMMSVTTEFTIICLESVKDKRQREALIQHFKSFGQEIIEVSNTQMNQFCCNVLEVQDSQGKLFLTMSERAYNSFTQQQRSKIQLTHQIISAPLYTIEDVGGGGSRCMMAEIYLQAV